MCFLKVPELGLNPQLASNMKKQLMNFTEMNFFSPAVLDKEKF